MNIADILVGAVVLAALLLAIGFMTKKGTGSSCGGDCSSCGMSSSCRESEKDKK